MDARSRLIRSPAGDLLHSRGGSHKCQLRRTRHHRILDIIRRIHRTTLSLSSHSDNPRHLRLLRLPLLSALNNRRSSLPTRRPLSPPVPIPTLVRSDALTLLQSTDGAGISPESHIVTGGLGGSGCGADHPGADDTVWLGCCGDEGGGGGVEG